MSDAWIALIATALAGVGVKVIDHIFGRRKIQNDDQRTMRDELRLEIQSQKEEIARLEVDRDKWRTEYLDLRDEFSDLKVELTLALHNIKKEAQSAETKLPE